MADVASYITGIRARGISTSELDDDALTSLISEVLTEYSRYRPLVADRTFETIANQQKYTWSEIGDSAGMMAILVLWSPYQSGDEWTLARTLATLGVPQEAGYWHLPSQAIIESIKGSAWSANYGGDAYQRDIEGGDVYLNPTPETAGDTVYILYTKVLSAVTEVKTTDRDIFLDLVESCAAERVVNELAKSSQAVRIKTPEYERDLGSQIGVWRKRGREQRDRFIGKCNAGYAAAGRS